ncbi:hypothetical protein I4U23_023414 [Adineta vaga]|nr:hypothetical protein I4U23_023414 [Adineta vaga]
MKMYLSLILLILYSYYPIRCAQPYFPPQIVFSVNNSTIYGIDEINQQAFVTYRYGASGQESGFVMKKFPYAIPDSPQSKYYVQLIVDSTPLGCLYGTYWKYGGNGYNLFPSNWVNGTSFYVGNYISFKYQMIHSTNSSSSDEDYWYADQSCEVDGGETYPCQEIYFKKNTEIPLRFTQVIRRGWTVIQQTINYQVISMGKPDEKYYDSIPKDWSLICRDVNLGLFYYPQTAKLNVQQSSQVQIWLITPPHRIDGDDTVTIHWQSMDCQDCFTWTPKELSFNSRNFNEKQSLTITRVKNCSKTTLQPIFNGGGFDLVLPQLYPIYIE